MYFTRQASSIHFNAGVRPKSSCILPGRQIAFILMLEPGLNHRVFYQATHHHVMVRSKACGAVSIAGVPMGSPSRGGDVAVYVFNINQLSLPTPFYSVLVSISVFMALSLIHI